MKAFLPAIAFFLFTTFLIGYSSCVKEYSYEGGPPAVINPGTAIYTFDGAGSNCAGAVINGTYVKGTALTSANQVVLRVTVTTPGTFSLNTAVVDGIQFSSQGSFTTTGLQTITLTGKGTPASEGIFSFATSATAACDFLLTVSTPSPQEATFTLAGEPTGCSGFTVLGNYFSGMGLQVSNTVDLGVNVTAPGSWKITTDTVNGISFSQSGNFTATGIQNVTLQGFGTPLAPGIFTFIPKAGTSGCTFSITVLSPEPPATYVLESNVDSSCRYSVSGTYNAGTPLMKTNNLAVKIDVTTLGSYTISTDTVNGMTFSSTGTLITLGSQVVILTGSGTPLATGTFSLTPQIVGPHPLGGETCKASIEVL